MSELKDLFDEYKFKYRDNYSEEVQNNFYEFTMLYVNDICNIKRTNERYRINIFTCHDSVTMDINGEKNYIYTRPIMGGYDIEDVVSELLTNKYYQDVEIFNNDYIVKYSQQRRVYFIIHKQDYYKIMNKRGIQSEINKYYKK